MARSLVPVLSLAAILSACTHNSPAGSGAEPRSVSNAAAAGRTLEGTRGGPLRGDQLLLRDITLTEDQQQRINAIRSSYGVQMNRARDESRGDRGADRDKIRALMEQQRTDIRAVLTAEQQVQFDKNVVELRARMEGGGGRPGGAPPA